MNRRGVSTGQLLFATSVTVILVTFSMAMQPTQSQKEAAVRTEREKISSPYQDEYEETLRNTVNWLLNDSKGPLSERDRGKFLRAIANGTGSTTMKYQGTLSAFSVLDWPDAKAAYKLADKMHGFIGLMERVEEGHYRTFAQTEFDEANKTLNELIPKRE